MAKQIIKQCFILNLMFILIEVSSNIVDKTCNNGSSMFKLEKPGSRRFQEECCPGYRQQVSNESTPHTTWMKCVPNCIPACKNGTCQSPGVCACQPGFKPDLEQKNNCIPHCSDGCFHGTCVSPEQCYCDHGYQYDLDVELCQPVCTEPCHNGTCIAPENCQCYPGFRKSEANECQPYCSVGCDHGHCIGPDNCACNPGWRHSTYSELNQGLCKPICSSCDGICVAPGECTKRTGTELDSTETSTNGEVTITTDWSNDAITSTEKLDYDVNDKNDKIISDQTNIFVIIGSLLFTACLVSLVILILKWTKLLDYILGKSYAIEDKGDADLNMKHL